VEDLTDLFLELAHGDRLRALFLIEKERLKLTGISETLNLSMPETSRHLSRLRDAKLIRKDVDGFYYLTPYGRITLHLLHGYSFNHKNRDYFQDHEPSLLPSEFIARIGELEEHKSGEGVMQILHLAVVVMEEAKKYVWILADQVMTSIIPMIREGYVKGVRFRVLLPKQLTLPSGFQLTEPSPTSPIEIRWLREVRVCIVMNETLAGLCLPNSAGKIDYSIGFAGRDLKFHKWCRDVFMHYWRRGKESPIEK